ncbi:E3 ubiquitin-protein ligase PUB24-like [Senna tora]|uniref:U-box domain-containing protein n=1 Tax=Senna tora TaxID=362788 RepID=A0A834WDS9_9FABA|nr:E3 ubiquitin-protein ligase PUB24-like [Senna tora]
MEEVEIPQYFICPISLQIMKDPVTAITGITYDRDSIERWLFTNNNTICPVTKQPLPLDSDLTPNHTLRRLIQAWCTQNASLGVDRIPTPKPPLTKSQALKILHNFHLHPHRRLPILTQLELLAAENDRNKKCLIDAGVPKAVLLFLLDCFKSRQLHQGLQQALSLLQFVRIPSEEIKAVISENDQILDSLVWILGCEIVESDSVSVKSHALIVLKTIIHKAGSGILERLEPEFFERIVRILRKGITQQGMNAGLKVMVAACPWGRNRKMMVDAGAVWELIEIELGIPERRTTELVLEILFHLCSCANGRAQFVSHRGGIAVITERVLKISRSVDERAVFILSLISNSSYGSHMVIQEMLKLGTVSKLCMLLQSDHPTYLKEKAMEMLKAHSEVWKNSPCFPDRSFYASLHK